jgi:hypothetical protein
MTFGMHGDMVSSRIGELGELAPHGPSARRLRAAGRADGTTGRIGVRARIGLGLVEAGLRILASHRSTWANPHAGPVSNSRAVQSS